jgi:hypothetical protein
MQYTHRITQITVCPVGKKTYDELSTLVEACSNESGEFVEVKQNHGEASGLRINKSEWPALRDAIDKMIEECRE